MTVKYVNGYTWGVNGSKGCKNSKDIEVAGIVNVSVLSLGRYARSSKMLWCR